jgi:hypothetical protein
MKTDAILQQVAQIDPELGHTSNAPSPRDARLLAILDTTRTDKKSVYSLDRTAPRRSFAWQPKHRWALVGATAVTVTALGALGFPGPWHSAPAFATWTATPETLSAEELAMRIDRCPEQFPSPEGDGPELSPMLVDVRGNYTIVIRADHQQFLQCYEEIDPATGVQRIGTSEAGPDVFTDVLDNASKRGLAPLSSQGISTESNGVTSWGNVVDSHGAVAIAFGRVGDDVAAVQAAMPDGRVVSASVDNGWWILWVPGDQPLPDTATITRADGSQAEVSIRP